MGNYLKIGNDGFKSITKGIYIDKTEMIAFINGTLGTADKLTCVSRPRRFGKSFAPRCFARTTIKAVIRKACSQIIRSRWICHLKNTSIDMM